MAKRIISAAIAVPIGIIVLALDNIPLFIVVFSALSVVAVYELLVATKYIKNKITSVISLTFTFLVPIFFSVPFLRKNIITICCAFIFALFIAMLFMHDRVSFEQITLVGFISVGIPLALCSLVFIRMIDVEHGLFCMVFALISAWIGDAGAYFIGTFFGKHKMAPKISPKKTWEGFFGGLAASGIAGFIMAIAYEMTQYYMQGINTFTVNKPYLVIIAVVCSVLGVVGDFSASIIKRQCSVKDFGNILPGHGGVLDRFDSVIFVAPFVYQAFQIYFPIINL